MTDTKLTPCSVCTWLYPEELVSPIVSSSGDKADVCGICALEISNRVSGVKRKKFDGPQAEGLRLAAIKWRKGRNHGNDE